MFANLTISKKIGITFLGITFICCGAAFIGFLGLKDTGRNLDNLVNGQGALALLSNKISFDNMMLRRYEKDFFLNIGDEKEQALYLEKFNSTALRLEKNVEKAIEMVEKGQNVDLATKSSARKLRDDLRAYVDGARGVFSEVSNNKTLTSQDANRLMRNIKEPTHSLEKGSIGISDAAVKLLSEVSEASIAKSNRAILAMPIILVFSFSLSIVMGLVLLRQIVVPIKAATKIASSGNLSLRLEASSKDELGDLNRAFNNLTDRLIRKTEEASAIAKGNLTIRIEKISQEDTLGAAFEDMVMKLSNLVNEVETSVQQVAGGAEQVSSASQALSQGATEQAAAVEEITSSLTEINVKIKVNADSAVVANETAQKAQKAADMGNGQIEVTLRAMNEINSSSREISKIIKVIDDIAFQTNLLALNAAVEAARAGRHGKGFAVVAEEVRNLASRSAKAAKETTELIESSSRKVEKGLLEAQKTAESFQEIVQETVKVAAAIKTIADSSKEQASAIGQITSGVNQVNKVTQTITGGAEETASAAEELSGQSQLLIRSVSFFKTGNDRSRAESPKLVALSPASDEPTRKLLNDREFGRFKAS